MRVNATSPPRRSRDFGAISFARATLTRRNPRPCAAGEDVVEHRRGEPAGERVLLARVIAAEQRDLADGSDRRAVAELRRRRPDDTAGARTIVQRRPPARSRRARRSPARRHAVSRHSASSHGAHVARSAGVGALAGGAHRTAAATRVSLSANPSAASTHSRLVRQPGAVQRGEQEVAGPVAGEHPAGAVGAVRGRRQPDDHHPRPRRPQPGTGRPQYGWSAKDLRLTTATSSRHCHQPRTGPAHRHLGVELARRVRTAPARSRHLRRRRRDSVSRRGRVTGPPGTRGHRRVEQRAGARMGQLHRHTNTVHAVQIGMPGGPRRC